MYRPDPTRGPDGAPALGVAVVAMVLIGVPIVGGWALTQYASTDGGRPRSGGGWAGVPDAGGPIAPARVADPAPRPAEPLAFQPPDDPPFADPPPRFQARPGAIRADPVPAAKPLTRLMVVRAERGNGAVTAAVRVEPADAETDRGYFLIVRAADRTARQPLFPARGPESTHTVRGTAPPGYAGLIEIWVVRREANGAELRVSNTLPIPAGYRTAAFPLAGL